jgi:hypothetical protein
LLNETIAKAIFKPLPVIRYMSYIAGLIIEYPKYTDAVKDYTPFYFMMGGFAVSTLLYSIECIYTVIRMCYPVADSLLPVNISQSEKSEILKKTRKRTLLMTLASALYLAGCSIIGFSDNNDLRSYLYAAMYFKAMILFGNAAWVDAGLSRKKQEISPMGYALAELSEVDILIFCVLIGILFIAFMFLETVRVYITWIVLEILKVLLFGLSAMAQVIYDV